MSKHTRTDPACAEYAPPTTWWQRRRHDRARGRSCTTCMTTATVAVVDDMLDEMLNRPRCRCGLMLVRRGETHACVHCDSPCPGTRSTCARCRALHRVA